PKACDPGKSALKARAPPAGGRLREPRLPAIGNVPLSINCCQPSSSSERGTNLPLSATMKWGSIPFVVLSRASTRTGFPSAAPVAWVCAQPFGILTVAAPSDEVTGPRAPVKSRPGTKRPRTTIPARAPPPISSHCGQLIPEPDCAGDGKGASVVGWTGAAGGVTTV